MGKVHHPFQGDRSALAGVAVFSVAINALLLAVPLYAWQLLDQVLISRSADALLVLGLVALSALAAASVLELLRAAILNRVALRLDARLYGTAFDASFTAESALDNQPHQSFSDIRALRALLLSPALPAVLDTLFLPLLIGAIFLINPTLGGLTLAIALTTTVFVVFGQTRAGAAAAAADAAEQHAEAQLLDRLHGADDARSMGLVPNFLRHWLSHAEGHFERRLRAAGRDALLKAGVRFARLSGQVLVLGVGAALIINDAITFGAAAAAFMLSDRALALLARAAGGWRPARGGWAAYRRWRGRLLTAAASVGPIELPEPIGQLSVDGLSYVTPKTRREVLSEVDFSLAPGDALALIGPSGGGKSTLAKLLVGVCRPNQGMVRLDSVNLQVWWAEQLGDWVGYLPQRARLFDGSVRDNIARFRPGAGYGEVIKAAKRAQVHEQLLKLPDGYNTRVGDGGGLLSVTERQCVALARCFFGDPKLLVLDEPTASLDPGGKQCLLGAVAGARREGLTVVVISHYPDLLNMMDKVLLLVDGKVAKFGARGEVIPPAQPPVIRHGGPLKVVGGVG